MEWVSRMASLIRDSPSHLCSADLPPCPEGTLYQEIKGSLQRSTEYLPLQEDQGAADRLKGGEAIGTGAAA